MLKQFVRDRQNRKVGVLLADKIDGQVRVGFSFARPHCWDHTVEGYIKYGDDFNQERGEDIAHGRMWVGSDATCPGKYRYDVIGFIERANKYFQDAQHARFAMEDGLVSIVNVCEATA